MGKVKKYIPQAGDICKWDFFGGQIVMILSPIKTEHGNYIACTEKGFEINTGAVWYCNPEDLTLIHRP